VDVIGGHPFYVQLLGEALVASGPPLDEQSLKSALQDLLFSRTGRLALYFENEFHRLVGRATYLAAALQALADGPQRLTDVAETIGAASGATASYLERLGDAVKRNDEGRYELADATFGLWLRWSRPGGTVVPMRLVGDEAERAVAEYLARMGFELVYQSRGSRGAFDLLATRGAAQLGVQVKRSPLPLRFSLADWNRMEADAERFRWRWVVAAVTPEGQIAIMDPSLATCGQEARLDDSASISNILLWLERRSERPGI
jgi:Holliday junction resolvase